MTVGNRQYNEADLIQMQREAEDRVREMQQRARQTVGEPAQEDNRRWSSYPGIRGRPSPGRPLRGQPGQQYNGQPVPRGQGGRGTAPDSHSSPSGGRGSPPARPDPPEPAHDGRAEASSPPEREPRQERHPPPKPDAEKGAGTIIGDVMNALGLDEDYLLIIGLILILINQRADTTLILALAYLLI